jgi:hypothetical protein
LQGSAVIGNETARITRGDVVVVNYNATGDGYCLMASSPAGSQNTWYYISTKGGLQSFGTAACGTY